MKTYPIDKTLRVLELVADTKGMALDDVPEYVSLCEYLTCIDMNLNDQLPFAHDEVFEVYQKVFTQVMPECPGNAMDFHRRCQKI